jgi:hypothetical protein
MGGRLKGGRTDDQRTRRYKRGVYGLANPTYGEMMLQSRNLEDLKAKKLADTNILCTHKEV